MNGIKFDFNDIISLYTKNDSGGYDLSGWIFYHSAQNLIVKYLII